VALQYGHHDLEKTATAFSSMIFSALVFAADMVPGLWARVKRLRMKEMVGDLEVCCSLSVLVERGVYGII
jgi:hypothetical protein